MLAWLDDIMAHGYFFLATFPRHTYKTDSFKPSYHQTYSIQQDNNNMTDMTGGAEGLKISELRSISSLNTAKGRNLALEPDATEDEVDKLASTANKIVGRYCHTGEVWKKLIKRHVSITHSHGQY